MEQYRLLRSNKESGPYTAAGLIGLGLKPYDLVWKEGKSAAWRYPSEMQEFKAYVPAVEEQPFDRFFNKQAAKVAPTQPQQQPAVEATVVAAPTTKPRIRIKADWNQVDYPVAVKHAEAAPMPQHIPQPAPKPVAIANTATPPPNATNTASWQNSWLDWQQEQHAVKNASKNHAAKTIEKSKPVNVSASEYAAPELETKFSQSLDSLKQRYSETVLSAKAKAPEWYKFKSMAVIALLAIPVLGFGIWLGNGLHNPAKEAAKPALAAVPFTTAPAQATPPQVADNSNTAGVGVQGNTGENNAAAKQEKPNAKELVPGFDDGDNNKATVPAAVTKPNKKAIVKQVMTPPTTVEEKKYAKATPQQKAVAAQQQQKSFFAPPTNTSPSARNKVINPAFTAAPVSSNVVTQNKQQAVPQPYNAAKKEPENASPVFAHYTKQQKVEDFVSVEADQPYQQNIQNLALNVENVTDATVDLVVIDVQYYDANGKFKTGQTMYVKNIPVNETIRAKIPDNTAASKIKYRVSLVSVEQKGIYLVAE